MTLWEFLAHNSKVGAAYAPGVIRNLHCTHPHFNTLYVRWTRRRDFLTLDLATLEVEEEMRGRGLLTMLITQIRSRYPDLMLYVENATPRLGAHLKKIGFFEDTIIETCWYGLPKGQVWIESP